MQSYKKEPRHIYKIGGTAGDIEHFYILHFGWDEEITISHAARTDWTQEVDQWIQTAKRYTLEQFAQVVNTERKQINRRIMEMKPETKPEDLYQPIEAK